MRQYAEGRKFVHGVVERVGMDGFNKIFSSPLTLPRLDELADPDAWVARVHGRRLPSARSWPRSRRRSPRSGVAVRSARSPRSARARRVLVACSGGADSLALAAATAFVAPRLGLRAGLVTVDHGLQDGSAERADAVAAWARVGRARPGRWRSPSTWPVPAGRRRPPGTPATPRWSARPRAARRGRRPARAHPRRPGRDRAARARPRRRPARAGRDAVEPRGRRGDVPAPAARRCRATTPARRARRSACRPWEDPHNADPAYARSRVRATALPALVDALGPGVVANLARTAAARGGRRGGARCPGRGGAGRCAYRRGVVGRGARGVAARDPDPGAARVGAVARLPAGGAVAPPRRRARRAGHGLARSGADPPARRGDRRARLHPADLVPIAFHIGQFAEIGPRSARVGGAVRRRGRGTWPGRRAGSRRPAG